MLVALAPNRTRNRVVLPAAFLAATILGGIGTSVLVSIIAALVRPLQPAVTVVALIAALVVAVAALRHGASWIPQSRRQIERDVWLEAGPTAGTVLFGIEYGTGLRTYVTSAAPLVFTLTAVALDPSFAIWLSIGALFGLGRGIVPALVGVSARRSLAERVTQIGVFDRVFLLSAAALAAASFAAT